MGNKHGIAEEGDDSTTLSGVVHRTQARMGPLPVASRYHHLPRRLKDDYVLEGEVLGTGYNGQVVTARSRRSGDRFAVKSFIMEDVSPRTRDNLFAEVEIFLSMDHPHVVRLMEVYEDERQVSLVMECMEGGELYDRLRQRRVFSEADAQMTTRQLLLAINYLHSEGIVHRDLKLENFMYEEKGSDFVKLLDFGFSKFFEKHEEMEESLGTVSYVAPEVLSKSYSCGSCDMWSLGVVVFVLLSGSMPFAGHTNQEIIQRIRRGRFVMGRQRWSSVSGAAADFVKKLLVLDPRKRLSARQALVHPWLLQQQEDSARKAPAFVAEAFMGFSMASRFQQACMEMMAWSLSQKERRQLRQHFLALDRSQCGVIRRKDLRQYLHEEISPDAGNVESLVAGLDHLDIDGDGELHYSDFLAVMMSARLEQHEDILQATFRRFDKEDRGFITPRGTKQLLGVSVPTAEVDDAFRIADGNCDGRLDVGEFVAYLTDESKNRSNEIVVSGKLTSPKREDRPRLLGRLRLGSSGSWMLEKVKGRGCLRLAAEVDGRSMSPSPAVPA